MNKIDKLIKDLGLDRHIPYEIQQDEIMLGIFKKGLETLLEGEMDLHLGYNKGNRAQKRTKNKRNGHYQRKLDTSAGRIEDLSMPLRQKRRVCYQALRSKRDKDGPY